VFIGFHRTSEGVALSLGVNGTANVIVPSVSANETYFCVVQIDLNAGGSGEEIISAIVNPAAPSLSGPLSTSVSADVVAEGQTFTYMTVGGLYATNNGYVYFDEILMADSLAEVAPFDASFPNFASAPLITQNANRDFEFSATLAAGVEGTSVYACYGSAPGTENAETWENILLVTDSPIQDEAASVILSGTATNTCYYTAALAINDEHAVLSSPGDVFMTGEVAIAPGDNAKEDGLVEGSFIVSRPSTATSANLKVNYEISGGTAVSDVNYDSTPLTGTVTILAGNETATIPVVPLVDINSEGTTTLAASITAGLYYIGAAHSATVSIEKIPIPEGYNVWIAPEAGNASDAANWSGGVPSATDNIFLGIFSNADMTWDVDGINDLPDTVASWTQTSDYAGTVTLPVNFEDVSGAVFTNFTITGNAVIDNGIWTHPANGSSQDYRLRASIGGNFTLSSDASIDVQGKGYASGVSHGSHGGIANGNASTYGDPKYPVDIGACYTPSPGGGAILLDVGGNATVDGLITASGITTSVLTGGAGGSVLIDAQSISGTGKISADGAMGSKNDWTGHSGSGGRIALLTDAPLAFPTNLVTAYGRVTATDNNSGSGAGTIFLKKTGDTYGTLVVVNSYVGQTLIGHQFKPFGYRAVTPVNADETWTFDAILTGGYGVMSVPSGTTLELPGGFASVKSLDTTTPVIDGIRYDGGTLDIGDFATQTISGGWCFQAAQPYVIDGNLIVTDSASVGICRLRQYVGQGSEGYLGCDLTVKGDMTVESTGFIEARYGGFWNNNATFPRTTHGGRSGAYPADDTHDSILSPALPAGGYMANDAFYAGGGVIKLTVLGNLKLDGKANANGMRESGYVDLNNYSAGGTLNFTLGSLSGSGSISALGGINTRQGGAGGGRIAVRLTDSEANFESWYSKINANARSTAISSSYAKNGSAGTVYLEAAADGADRGLIIIRNDDNSNNLITTPFPATGLNADDPASLRKASLSIEKCGRIMLTDNVKIESLSIEEQSTVDVAGLTLTVQSMEADGETVPAGIYAQGSSLFTEGFVSDSESGGRVIVLGAATMLLVR
jgi:hypothetical protein